MNILSGGEWLALRLVLAALLLALSIPAWILLLLARKTMLVERRSLWSSLLVQLGLVLWGVAFLLNCQLEVVQHAGLFLAGTFVLERCFSLFVIFMINASAKGGNVKNMTAAATSVVSSSESCVRGTGSDNFIFRFIWTRRHLFDNRFFSLPRIIAILISLGLILADAWTYYAADHRLSCTLTFLEPSYLLLAYLLSLVVGFLLILPKFKQIQENFLIKEELLVIVSLCLLIAVSLIGLRFSSGNLAAQALACLFCGFMFPFLSVLVSSYWILWKIRKTGNNSKIKSRKHTSNVRQAGSRGSQLSPGSKVGLTVENILVDPKLDAMFEEFMAKEFCIESLLFLRAVNEFLGLFRDEEPPELIQMKAARIYRLFCSGEARFVINISSATRANLKQAFSSESTPVITETIFDAAKIEVERMIKDDKIPRFVRYLNSIGNPVSAVVLVSSKRSRGLSVASP